MKRMGKKTTKQQYETPEWEVFSLEDEDIVCTSGDPNQDDFFEDLPV